MELGLKEDPAAVARERLRDFQEAHGIEFDDPDAPIAAGPGEHDEEIPGDWMGGPRG